MIGNVFWSIADVCMSMIMNRVHSSAVVVSWFLSVVQVIVLAALYLLLSLEPVWIWEFALSGLFAYIGALAFFRLLQYVDVSVSSVSWVFLSVGIAIGGVVLFGETLTVLQVCGALLSIGGALALALWHKRVERLETMVLLLASGLLYVPSFLIQKAALLEGHTPATVFFWPFLFFCLYAILFPFSCKRYRTQIRSIVKNVDPFFVVIVICWVLTATLGYFTITTAYSLGDAALVGITENGQPFFLMFFAWIATLLLPAYAPREIITAQTTRVKIVTFMVVFLGLGLLVA